MATSRMPYQRLQRSGDVLIAARGSSIDTFDLINGSFLSSWSTAPKPTQTTTPATSEAPDASSPPAKRRKVSDEEDTADIEGAATTSETNAKTNGNSNGQSKAQKKKQQNQKSRAESASSGFEHPAVICLAATEDGKHIVAVTAEDKSVRVLERIATENGKQELKEISIR
jgi:tRNA (guanine-N(7)-)-methyltransferase subunit TRM82